MLYKQNVDVTLHRQEVSISSVVYDITPIPDRSMGHLQINMISSLPSSAIADTCQDTKRARLIVSFYNIVYVWVFLCVHMCVLMRRFLWVPCVHLCVEAREQLWMSLLRRLKQEEVFKGEMGNIT